MNASGVSNKQREEDMKLLRKLAKNYKNVDLEDCEDLVDILHDIISKNGGNGSSMTAIDFKEEIIGYFDLSNKMNSLTLKWGLSEEPIGTQSSGEYIQKTQRPKSKIEIPPGYFVSRILKFLYSGKTYRSIFETQLADMEFEYIEALVAGEKLKAKWVQVRGHSHLIATIFLHVWSSTVGKFVRSIIGSP